MSTRNTVLDGFKSCLQNITTANGFNTNVLTVERKFLFFDKVANYPSLMVLGGPERYDDELGPDTFSYLTIRIIGYTKDTKEPEVASSALIGDVLKCLDNDSYNSFKSKMRILDVDTDEGMIHDLSEGIAMFVLSVEVLYKFARSAP